VEVERASCVENSSESTKKFATEMTESGALETAPALALIVVAIAVVVVIVVVVVAEAG